MNFFRLLPPFVAFVLLAAHFARAGAWLPATAALAVCGLAAVPRPWAARLLQLALVAGALEWLRTLYTLAAARAMLGQPYLRLAAILGAVALMTVASALVFRSAALRRHFQLR